MKTIYYHILIAVFLVAPLTRANSMIRNVSDLDTTDLIEVDFRTRSMPFSPQQELKLVVHDPGIVTIDIFTPQGTRVCNVLSKNLEKGDYSLYWNGRDTAQQLVESGVYICVLSFGPKKIMRTLTLLR
ncbi:MAG: hypothetical protein U5R06_16290 [candidate division KSB1 bacterium]|nr:hypothetical protein [candidate division KSB1 bacterium]